MDQRNKRYEATPPVIIDEVFPNTHDNADWRLPVGVDAVESPPDYELKHPLLTGAEEARMLAELERLLAADDELTRNGDSPKRGVLPRERDLLRAIASSRRCESPVGLVLEGQTEPSERDLAIAPCRACPSCRSWEQALDAWRLHETAGEALAVAVIPEEKWKATKQRLTRSGVAYLAIPSEGGRRALLVPTDSPVPAAPVGDLAELLANLERQRNRSDRRRISSSGLRSRAESEALVYSPAEEEPQARSVVGYFSSRALSASDNLREVAITLEAAANAIGIRTHRRGLVLEVDGQRTGPVLDRFWRLIGVQWIPEAIPWYQGGPPPRIDSPDWETWKSARFGNAPAFEDPPLSAYPEAV